MGEGRKGGRKAKRFHGLVKKNIEITFSGSQGEVQEMRSNRERRGGSR